MRRVNWTIFLIKCCENNFRCFNTEEIILISSQQHNEADGHKIHVTKVIFDYGPPELNLFKYVAVEADFLWENVKKLHNLKDYYEPLDGLVLIHDDDCDIAERYLKMFQFDVDLSTGDIGQGKFF